MSLFVIVAALLGLAGVCSSTPIAMSTCPACNKYLVSGVDDSQLSESNYYCQQTQYDCTQYQDGTPTSASAKYARLNATGFINGGWISTDSNPADSYVQVDFRCTKVITAIALKGRDPAAYSGGKVNQYIKSFKVQVSNDCTNFKYISTGSAPMIFEGNTEPDVKVVRNLPEKVAARCVRIYPVEYKGIHKSLRFDVLGC